jgi:uncharacterized protein YjbJ (UPF0337 family)
VGIFSLARVVPAGKPTWPEAPNADARFYRIPETVLVEGSRKRKRRNQMKPSTKDQAEGKFHELKGDVKQKAGQVTNDPNLETKGQNEKLAGKVQKKVGQIEGVIEK